MSPSLWNGQSVGNDLPRGSETHCSWDMFRGEEILQWKEGREESGRSSGEFKAWRCRRGRRGPSEAAQGVGSAGRGSRRPWGAMEGPLSAGGS